MINSANVTIFGNVWGDPKTPVSTNPNFVTFKCWIAKKWKDKQTGEEKKRTTWFECKSNYPSKSQIIKNIIRDGQKICVVGAIGCELYFDRNKAPVAKLVVEVDTVNVLGERKDNLASGENNEEINGNIDPVEIIGQDAGAFDELPF